MNKYSRRTFATISKLLAPKVLLSSADRGWSGVRVERQLRQPSEMSFPPAPVHLLVYTLKEIPRQVFRFGGKNFEGPRVVGGTCILPAGRESFFAWNAQSEK